jgi:hypothetical protein
VTKAQSFGSDPIFTEPLPLQVVTREPTSETELMPLSLVAASLY